MNWNPLHILKPAAHTVRLPDSEVEAAYRRHRRINFAGIFISYATFYLLRGNFAIASPYLIKFFSFSKTQLGAAASFLTIAYGLSKFVMGNVSDRSNPRYFIGIGLALASLVTIMLGVVCGRGATIPVIGIFMAMTGWVNGMGAPPCYRTVAHWFSITQRGRLMSIWNISHNVGGSLLGAITMLSIPYFGWKSIFFVPPVIGFIVAVMIVITMRDTPQSVGLMPVEEYSKEYPDNYVAGVAEEELTGKEILFKYVFPNKYVWFLGLANAFVYAIRFGVTTWAPLYFAEVRGVKLAKAGLPSILFETAGIVGMLLCGYLSDRVFKGRRAPVSILSMAFVCVGLLFYWLSPSIIGAYAGVTIIGMFIYGPVMLVGVQVLDIIPKKAVGTAVGFLGLFGYWLGSTGAGIGLGALVQHFGWTVGNITLLGCAAMAAFFFSLTLNIKSVKKADA